MNFEDDELKKDRINEVSKSPFIDPRIDPKGALDAHIYALMEERKKELSPRQQNIDDIAFRHSRNTKSNLGLMKNLADFGASFANTRYKDPKSDIPTSSFDPSQAQQNVDEGVAYSKSMKDRRDKYKDMDTNVLKYLSEKKQKEDADKADRELKEKLAGMKAKYEPKSGGMTEYQREMLKLREKALGRSNENRDLQNERLGYAVEEAKNKAVKSQVEASKEDEAVYRYKSTLKQIDALRDSVKNTEWWQSFSGSEAVGNLLTGGNSTKSGELESSIYNLALDYAKIVDPTSVAREGEVSAAQKYAIPVQRYIFTGNKEGALNILEKYKRDVEARTTSMYKDNKIPDIFPQQQTQNAPQPNPKLDRLKSLYDKETDPAKKEELKKFMDIEAKKNG